MEISEGAREQIRVLLEWGQSPAARTRPQAGTFSKDAVISRPRQDCGLRSAVSSVRWVKPEQMHLTLAFLGEVTQDFIESAKERLGSAAAEHESFSCRLKGLGAFPSPARARVVWIGIEEGKEQLKRLQASVSRELVKIGYVSEKRSYSPHLTLGRLKMPADVQGICRTGFESERFIIDRVVLFQSILRPEGPEYVKLGAWVLAGGHC